MKIISPFGGGKWKKMILVLSSVLVFLLAGCHSNVQVLSTAISQINTKSNKHAEQLHAYDSPYTICYKNRDDTYSMYIFASPIQFMEENRYHIIDNTVVVSKREPFAYENKANDIKTHFPKNLTNYILVENGMDTLQFKPCLDETKVSAPQAQIIENMYGDRVSAVIYKSNDMDFVFYPTKAGIRTEIVLNTRPKNNSFHFFVVADAENYENKQNGYILFKNGVTNKYLIYQPLVKYSSDNKVKLDVTTQLFINREGDGYHVEMIIDETILNEAEYPIKLDPSFEIYLNKMPDTSVYAKFDTNSYLRHYAVIGEHPVLGEGWEYIRLRLNYFMTLSSSHILSAKYSCRLLKSSSGKIKIYEMMETWSSTSMLWQNKKIKQKQLAIDYNMQNSYMEFDITGFVKEAVDDITWRRESYGLVLKVDGESTYITTSDHSLYPPYLCLTLNSLPRRFIPPENINPNI